MLELNKVHTLTKPGLNEPSRLVSVNPYICLSGENAESPVFIQGGKVYYAGGDEVKKLPVWFAEEVAKCSPEALAEVGFKVKEK